jgi:diguanylate cyclase
VIATPLVMSTSDHVMAGAGVALGVVSMVFGTTVILRHDSRSDRIWLTGFMAALVAVAAPILLRSGGGGRVEPGLAVLGAAYAVYALWAGARIFADRPPHTLEGMGASIALALVAQMAHGPLPALGTAILVLLSVGAFAVAVEVWRGPMRTNLNAEILMAACILAGVAGLVEAPFFTSRPWGPTTCNWSAPLILALGVVGLYLVAGMTLTGLRVERHGVWWAISEDHNLRRLGLLGPETFEADARDRIERSARLEEPVTLLLVAIADLPELNAAFGRDTGDAALAFVAGVLRDQLPPSALIGMTGGGTFGVVSSRAPEVLEAAVETGMLRTSLPETLDMRVSARYGSGTAAVCGYDYAELRSRALDALDSFGRR